MTEQEERLPALGDSADEPDFAGEHDATTVDGRIVTGDADPEVLDQE